ncbi:phenylacetate-CoA oxygenase subunit PaaJ [Schleiferiaceae bacterium]|nr:phenylacetate-CoA oxygenase subunit PaaJ [Schleiferiaceae bacterium]
MNQSASIYEHLGRVKDPEIPVMSLHDMGILRDVAILPKEDGRYSKALQLFKDIHPNVTFSQTEFVYQITISPTYVGCPAMDRMEQDIKEAMYVLQLPFIVEQQLQPPWTTDWISEDGRIKMEEYGIAPPIKENLDKRILFAEAPKVNCPKCKSKNTRMLSRHGSTACKSQYACNNCLEPFEYFKCL